MDMAVDLISPNLQHDRDVPSGEAMQTRWGYLPSLP